KVNVIEEKNQSKITITIAKKNQVIDLATIGVVYMRYFDTNNIDFQDDIAFVNKFMRQEWLDTLEIIKERTSKAIWINRFDAVERLEHNKARQLSLAKSIGFFDIPCTLITNDPEQARRFYYNHDCDVIVKG